MALAPLPAPLVAVAVGLRPRALALEHPVAELAAVDGAVREDLDAAAVRHRRSFALDLAPVLQVLASAGVAVRKLTPPPVPTTRMCAHDTQAGLLSVIQVAGVGCLSTGKKTLGEKALAA